MVDDFADRLTAGHGDLTDTALGGYSLLRVDRVTPPTLEPFDKVRQAVEAAWRLDKLTAAAKARADKLLGELKAGRPLDDVAAEMKLAPKTSSPFTRFEQSGDTPLPGSLAAPLFRAKIGDPVSGATSVGFAVGVLDKIEPSNPDADKEGLDALRSELRTAVAGDLLAQYTRALRKLYPVSIDNGAVDRFFEQGAGYGGGRG